MLRAIGLSSQTPVGGWAENRPLLSGDRGTAETIDVIRQVVWQGLSDPRVHAAIASIVQNVPPYDDQATAKAIFNWVLQNIRFTNDPVGHETVRTPNWILTYRIGDCDDINAVLIPTLLMAVGIPAQIITIANDSTSPSEFTHVYAQARIGNQWINMDAARPNASYGTAVSQYSRMRVWPLTSEGYQDLKGLSGCACEKADWSNGAAGMAGVLGDDSGDGSWIDNLSKIIATAGTAATKAIQATQGVYTTPGGQMIVLPQTGQIAPGVYGGSTVGGSISGSSNLLLLGVMAIGIIALMGRR